MRWWTIRQLKSKNVDTRKRAIEKLSATGDNSAIEILIDALACPELQDEIVKALVKLGSRSVKALIAALKHNSLYVREQATKILGDVGDEEVVRPLLVALRDKHFSVRKSAAEALVKLRWQPENEAQKAWYAVAMSKFDDAVAQGASAVEPLLFCIGPYRYYPDQAIESLIRVGSAAVEPLVTALRHEYFPIRAVAAIALTELNWQTRNASERALIAVGIGDYYKASEERAVAVEPLVVALKGRDDWDDSKRIARLPQIKEILIEAPDLLSDLRPGEARRAMRALEAILTENTSDIPSEDLQTILTLPNQITVEYCFGLERGFYYAHSSRVKRLAEQELNRRGHS